MKKKIIFIGCLLMTVVTYSQEKDIKALYHQFLISGGVTFSTIGGGDSWEGMLAGGHFGAGILIDPGKRGHIAYTGQICWDMMGSKYDEGLFNGKVTLSYLNIPLMMQHTSEGGFLVEGGLQPGFLTSAKDKYSGNNDDYKDFVNSFHFGIPVGIGYVFVKTVGINLRYTQGLSNINKLDDGNDYNRYFTLRLFWLLGSKK